MKKITLILMLFFSISIQAQTVYQLDHIHRYKWENNDWLRITEEYYEYDNNGTKETDILNKTSVDGIIFQDNFRHTKTYNNNNFILVDLRELWDGANWNNSTRQTKTYDNSDRILTDLRENHNGSNWENNDYSEYSYNDSENTSEILYYDKYEANNWVLYRQTKDAITGTGSEREVWVKSFITNMLEPESKSITTITNGIYFGEITQSWDDNLMPPDWVNNEKLEVSYTIDNQWDKFEYYYWDTDINDWKSESYQRTSYIRDDPTYDLITLIENNEMGTWINDARILSIRDSNNLLSSTTQSWEDSSWSTFRTTTYEYDGNNNNTKRITQQDIGMGLVNTFRTDLFWVEGIGLSVSFNSLTSVHPYPNPTTDVINVKFKKPLEYSSQASIYNIHGKLIYNTIIKKESSLLKIPIKYQTNGVYLLHLKTKDATEVFKIVKNN